MTGLLILIPIIIALTIFITNYNSKNKKDKKTDVFENKFTKDESEFVILLGSETSSTIGFASLFKDALLSLDKKVFLSNLNDYSSYKKAKQLIDEDLISFVGTDCHNIRQARNLEQCFTHPLWHQLLKSDKLLNNTL